jgi:hypothetical protein
VKRILLSIAIFAAIGSARPADPLSPRERISLNIFLRQYLKDADYDYKSTRYVAAVAHLEENKRDIIVYFSDPHSCGSGGCTTLVLAPDPVSSYRIVTSITIVWPPIRILATKTNGWHDIGVWVQGGGIQPGYEAVLSFDGRSYPRNPTVPPAKRAEHARGEVLIDRRDPDSSPF